MKKAVSMAHLFMLLVSCNTHGQLVVSRSVCENRINPYGVDVGTIHFGWELTATENDQFQTAYQIEIASSSSGLAKGNHDVWDSSVITSAQSVFVPYKGRKLQPGQTYFWRVRVWDKHNQASAWSTTQKFTTGLFSLADWAGAKWIGYEDLADSMRVAPGVHAPLANELGDKCMQRPVVPLFRRMFTIEKKVKKALFFISGLGHYEFTVNGITASKAFLAPGWTYFDKRALYNSYDVTDLLNRGENTLGVIVGNGFYNINRERYYKITTAFGMPKMMCQLKIVYEDGKQENIVSDGRWKTSPSPITFSSLYGGEDYDARLEQDGWNTSNFNDSNWERALEVRAPRGKLTPEQDYPVILADTISVKKVVATGNNSYLYDFGQNASGIVRLKVKGRRGQTIKLIPAELINANRRPNQTASGEPFIFSYTLKGDSEEIWQPKFSYYGFRYVQVEGATPDTAANLSDLPVITGLELLHNRNSNSVNGSFQCSSELFNRINTLILWAIRSNMQSVITDCPHREKLSWLEQDYLMGGSIHYNYDIYNLYRKLVFDLMDAQYPQGFVPDIAPEYVVFADGFLDSPEWGSSAVILPWLLYNWYGDVDIMRRAYPMMKRYVEYLGTKADDYILSHGLGDWFDYGPRQPGEAQLTPKAVTATAIYYYDVVLLSKMASILKHEADMKLFEQLAIEIKQSFNSKFFNPVTKVYATGSQTAMAMPYCVGLVEEENKKDVLQNLVNSIYAANKALTAGDIGFHFLVKALDDGGASQLIFDMNNRDDVPGYGFQLRKGATALTESWPALENVSNNHLMLGHIMEWFYSGLAGIAQQENSIAFKHIKIRPQPVGDITFARATFHSPYGWIVSDWRKEEEAFLLHVKIPVNAVATVALPVTVSSRVSMNGKLIDIDNDTTEERQNIAVIEIGSGDYNFEVR